MKQITLIVVLSVVGFAAALAAFIAGRLNAEEVALLSGVVCGIGVAVPFGVMAGTVLAGRRRRDLPATSLPVIYVTQPPQPTVVGSQPIGARLPPPQPAAPAARALNIIGQNAFDADK
ncbi:MAG: hypothetical protein HY870_15480 [Chloroflexi bacterium]|nr:hypothetical protein [Chloroflexota bacterium]